MILSVLPLRWNRIKVSTYVFSNIIIFRIPIFNHYCYQEVLLLLLLNLNIIINIFLARSIFITVFRIYKSIQLQL